MLPDKKTVTLHAQLLTTLTVQINYLCYLCRCGEAEQTANVIDCCIFDLRLIFDQGFPQEYGVASQWEKVAS